MHQQHFQEIADAIKILFDQQKQTMEVLKEWHTFLMELKNERDTEKMPERIKALEDAYAELLLLGKAPDVKTGME